MKNYNVIALTLDEVRSGLIDFYVSVLKDESFTRDALTNNQIHFNLLDMPENKLVDLYAELCLGESVLKENAGDVIAYEDKDGNLLFLACREQMHPREQACLSTGG